jgi:hypothetical protein
MSYRSTKLLKSANGLPCVLCLSTGTTVAAHSTQVTHGHGTGCKAPDYFVAYVCQECHDLIDGRRGFLNKEEKREMWNRAFQRTVALWFEQGIVGVR